MRHCGEVNKIQQRVSRDFSTIRFVFPAVIPLCPEARLTLPPDGKGGVGPELLGLLRLNQKHVIKKIRKNVLFSFPLEDSNWMNKVK